MFELAALLVIRSVTEPTSLSSDFEIKHKQVPYGDELTLDILTDEMIPTREPSKNVGKGTVSRGSS